MDSSRNLRRAVFAGFVAATIAGCSAATPSLSPAPSATAVATIGATSPGPSATILATSSPSAAPETAAPSGSPSLAPYPELSIPADLIHQIPLPAGAEVLGADPDNPFWGEIAADGDWLATKLSFQGLAPGHDTQLYAVNIITGASRRLADHSARVSVANGRAAWVDPKCVYTDPWEGEVCSAWTLHLMDLATGSDRVVATGSVTERVADFLWLYQKQVIPTAALSSDTLAYTTGDLKHGFTLHLLSISSRSERTVGLGGMIQEMSWAGGDLMWIEDTDLHHDNGASPSYTGTRLMLLRAGAEEASQIGLGPVALVADSTGIVWTDSHTLLRASGPDWTSVGLGPLLSLQTVDWVSLSLLIRISDGWTGWLEPVAITTDCPASRDLGLTLSGAYRSCVDPYLVLRPQDSVPRVVPYGSYLSGGWLFLVPRDPATEQPTGFEAVRIADLH